MIILCALLLALSGEVLFAQAPPLHVEYVLPKQMLFTGETARCILRVSFEQSFVREHLLPIVQRRTSLPFLLKTPFDNKALPGWHWLPSPAPSSGPTLAVDDAVVTVAPSPAVVRNGTRHAVVDIERRFRITQAGRVILPRARLICASTSGFETDFLGQRTPRDRTEVEVIAPAVELEVLPPPSLGRPAEFRGAIGRFTLHARADKTSAHVGDVVILSIDITGSGDMAALAPPTLGASPAFHLLGTRVELSPDMLIQHHELRVLDTTATVLPECALVSFDPDAEPPAYRRLVAPRIAIQLLAASAPTVLDAPSVHAGGMGPAAVAPLSSVDEALSDAPLAPAPWTTLALCTLPWGFAAALGLKRYVAARRLRDGGRRAARRATGLAIRALARGGDPGAILITWLAARLRLEPALVLGPELRERLHHASVPAELGVRVQRMVEATLAARWGAAAPLTRAPAEALILEMEAAMPAMEPTP